MSYQNLDEISATSFSFDIPTESGGSTLEKYIVEIETSTSALKYKAYEYNVVDSVYTKQSQVTSWDSISPNPNSSHYDRIKHGRNVVLYNLESSLENYANTNTLNLDELTQGFIKFTTWYLFSKIAEVKRLMITTSSAETHIVSALTGLNWIKEGTQRSLHIDETDTAVNCDIYSLLRTDPGANFIS